ncbi:TIM-barrel domain-containing protein [Listeria costaricensis]|uniref:TIM-barrel domain-containing protein n=1 Tax=Listeria costaricensis TaxID=2026604 RepID=UPI000C07F875|nr:TIM-barrel domain-containing protein [Listeria costaricensis]
MKKGFKQVFTSLSVASIALFGVLADVPITVPVSAEETGKKAEQKVAAYNGQANNLTQEQYDQVSAEEGLGNVINVTVTDNMVSLQIDNGDEADDDYLEITPLKNNLLKVNLRPSNVADSADTPMIDPDASFSAIEADIDTSGDPIVISTAACTLEIARNPARMTFKDKDGNVLLSESADGGIFNGGVRFKRGADDHIYGAYGISFGDGDLGMERDNTADANKTVQAGQQGNAGGPFMWSTDGYGILVDSDGGYPFSEASTGKLEFYYGDTVEEGRRYDKKNVELYLMAGNPEEIMASYADVTGHTPMMPKWSLGFSNFEWGINEEEFRNNVDTYRAKGIPIDAYAFDYDWKFYGDPVHGGDYGEFTWNTDNFPSAATTKLKEDMDEQNINMIGITKPRVVTNLEDGTPTQQGQDAAANGYFYPGQAPYQDYFVPVTVESIDPYNADERAWWWSHSEDAYNKGIVGWWNDETDKVSSGAAQYWFGNFTTGFMSQTMYEGQRDYTNDSERVWQTARTYYPGAQRYGTSMWSGDIGVQWKKGEVIDWANGMSEQPSTMLSSINLGQTKWGMDTGGFNANSGQVLNPDPELYTRWMEFSSVVPVFRTHGNDNQQRQPWYYGGTAEEMAKSSMIWRYSMVPYMYAYERNAYENGVGLVQPLTFNYPDDDNVANMTNEWMFGDNLLVAPILEEGAGSREIYLPAGTWIDYNRGDVYEGGQTISYQVDAENWSDLPMFVKQGAIIPMQQPEDHIDTTSAETIYLDTFASNETTTFTHYDDDGSSYDYEKGSSSYMKQAFEVSGSDSGSTFTVKAKTGDYNSNTSNYIVKLHGEAAENVNIDGSAATKYDDLTALEAAAGTGFATGTDVYGDVTYVKVAAQGTADTVIQTTGSSTAADKAVYEMEKGSLFAETLADRPEVSDGSVTGLDADGTGATVYANVKDSGDYSVDLTYKNTGSSAETLSIFVNGERVEEVKLAPAETVATSTLPLSAGKNSISYEVVKDAGDDGTNIELDKVELSTNPDVLKVEAEDAKMGGTLIENNEHWYYSGTGFVESFLNAGDELTFEVTVPEDGSYTLNTRTANGTGMPQSLDLYANGTYESRVEFPSYGQNWNIWSDTNTTVNLKAGVNKVSYLMDNGTTGNVNIDRILVSKEPITAPVSSEKNLLDDSGFERAASQTNNWTEWHADGQESAYGVDSGSGVNPPESPKFGDQSAYFYLPGAYQESIHQEIQVPKNNTNYDVSAWVKLSNTSPTTARMELSAYDSTSGQNVNLTDDGKWHYIHVENIHVTTGNLSVGFYVDSPGGTTLHIDNVSIEESLTE